MAQIFHDLQTTMIEAACIDKPNLVYFLMTLNWMKTYKTEEEISGMFNVIEKTARKWIWIFTNAIQALKESKVSFLGSCLGLFSSLTL